jgi:hypothetical protein
MAGKVKKSPVAKLVADAETVEVKVKKPRKPRAEKPKSEERQKLDALKAEKKRIADEQKVLREKLNEGAEERAEARKERAEVRATAFAAKKALHKALVIVPSVFQSADTFAIEELADAIVEDATALAAAVRQFSTHQNTINTL